MTKRTKKVGLTGKYGPRYGVTVRKQIKEVSGQMIKSQRCPACQSESVKRQASGIWVCRHCHLKFAASAYTTKTRGFRREEPEELEELEELKKKAEAFERGEEIKPERKKEEEELPDSPEVK